MKRRCVEDPQLQDDSDCEYQEELFRNVQCRRECTYQERDPWQILRRTAIIGLRST